MPFTAILFDIDYFKKVNDTYGHQVGDEVLVQVVNACKERLPKEALFGRYGGEEFVIALNGYDEAAGIDLANELCAFVAARPCATAKGAVNVTISLGVAEASCEQEETLLQLLNRADVALYEAKGAGRNRAQVSCKEGKLLRS